MSIHICVSRQSQQPNLTITLYTVPHVCVYVRAYVCTGHLAAGSKDGLVSLDEFKMVAALMSKESTKSELRAAHLWERVRQPVNLEKVTADSRLCVCAFVRRAVSQLRNVELYATNWYALYCIFVPCRYM